MLDLSLSELRWSNRTNHWFLRIERRWRKRQCLEKLWTCFQKEKEYWALQGRYSNTLHTFRSNVVGHCRQHCWLAFSVAPSALRSALTGLAARRKFEICGRKYFKSVLIDSWTRALILSPPEARPKTLHEVVRVRLYASELPARSKSWLGTVLSTVSLRVRSIKYQWGVGGGGEGVVVVVVCVWGEACTYSELESTSHSLYMGCQIWFNMLNNMLQQP